MAFSHAVACARIEWKGIRISSEHHQQGNPNYSNELSIVVMTILSARMNDCCGEDDVPSSQHHYGSTLAAPGKSDFRRIVSDA